MTRYQLPAELGGGECKLLSDPHAKGVYGRVQIGEGDTAFNINILRSLLTPACPPEPPTGSWVLVGRMAAHRDPEGTGGWWDSETQNWRTWPFLCGQAIQLTGQPPALLVLMPPVELPCTTGGVEVARTEDEGKPSNGVYLSTKSASYGFAHLTPATARAVARALWTAADQILAEREAGDPS